MSFKLYNFLSKKVEEFKPQKEVVTLYTCGPTVYDFVHIGNWRTFIFEDILRRVLEFGSYKVKHVMNITDIDDKILVAARSGRIAFREIAARYEKAFFEDLEKLNILRANFYPKATEHINSMIQIIEVLLAKGFAYKAGDGIYFDISKFKYYGKLSNLSKRQIKIGARIAADLYEKENPADFALWKFPKTGPVSSFHPAYAKASAGKPASNTNAALSLEAKRSGVGSPSTAATRYQTVEGEPVWEAPFGRGRPGWHIECSAMSMKYLGETFDIHTGGVDLLFPHHENEIAQSEAATGKRFVNFWLEGEHLLVEGEKMAKSLGNIFTLDDIQKKGLPAHSSLSLKVHPSESKTDRQGFEPLALRYLFLTAHYRSKLNFTWKGLEAARNALSNLREEMANWDKPKIGCAEYEGNFRSAINNDLDMPKALSVMWKMIKSDYPTSAKHQSILVMDKVLGLGLRKLERAQLPKGARELIAKREELRAKGKYEDSDKLRKKLQTIGVYIEDTPQGTKWKIKKNHHKI